MSGATSFSSASNSLPAALALVSTKKIFGHKAHRWSEWGGAVRGFDRHLSGGRV